MSLLTLCFLDWHTRSLPSYQLSTLSRLVFKKDAIYLLFPSHRYDPKVNEWSCDVAPLRESKRDVGLAELGGYLYCVGGHDGLLCLSTVERYVQSHARGWT